MKRFNTKNNITRQHKRVKKSVNQTSHILKRGQFGLRSLEHARADINQVNSLKKFLHREIKLLERKFHLGKIKFWFYMLPNKAMTKLSPETRMGKGKGPITNYCCYVKPGQLLFELANFPEEKISKLVLNLKNSFSFKTQTLVKFRTR